MASRKNSGPVPELPGTNGSGSGLHNRIGGLVGGGKKGLNGPTGSPPPPDPSGLVGNQTSFEMPGTALSWMRVVIAGTTEAMTNKMADSQIPQLLAGVIDKPKDKAPKPKSAEEAALRASHIALLRGYGADPALADDFYGGHVFGYKGIALKKGAVAAMSALSIKGKAKMMGAFFVHGPFNGLIPVLSSNPPWRPELVTSRGLRDPDELFALASQPSVDIRPIATTGMGGKGGASVSIRPKFDDWFIEAYVGHYGKVIPEKQLLQLIQQAGQSVGVGSYRAERSGDMFGLYQIVSATVLPAGFSPARYKLDPTGKPTK